MKTGIGAFFFVVALVFVYRSFYCMRIPEEKRLASNAEFSPRPPARAGGRFCFWA